MIDVGYILRDFVFLFILQILKEFFFIFQWQSFTGS